MKIAVIGQGLQSYVSAALFASVGNQVVLFQPDNIDDVASKEPGLARLIVQQRNAGRLTCLNSESEESFDIILLAEVSPTKALTRFSNELSVSIDNGAALIILTPSDIGEAHKLSASLNSQTNKKAVHVCSVPLLVREGRAIDDFSRPNSIIIGCDDDLLLNKIKALFYPFNRMKNVITEVTTREAEFSCFASNAMLATRLSFMNEMASLAEKTNVNIEVVRDCIGNDPRIGRDYLYPGCGYGGHALEENVAKVAAELSSRNDDLGLLDTVVRINDRQKDLLFRKIWKFFKTDLTGRTIGIWGASFKPGSASIEGAPAIKLVESLLAQSANVLIYDPMAADKLHQYFGDNSNLSIVNSQSEALDQADVLAICTEWKEFWSPDFDSIEGNLTNKAIFDGRNLYEPEMVEGYGIKYYGIGRGRVI
jgi:UDPglucose 6-dehydrogenase